jgi:flagellar basal body-associated protein FliL
MHGEMGAMMAGMGLVWILLIAVVLLAIVALLKYVLRS